MAGWIRFLARGLGCLSTGASGHGCPNHTAWPKQNAEFWRTKILRNRARDREVNRLLKKAGWRVLRIWEHALTKKHEARTMARLRRALASYRGR